MSSCTLGFMLRPVASHKDLLDACGVRAQAYGHHMPELSQQLSQPDALDYADGTTVFLCRDKATGRATGTMRIQTSAYGPLRMEDSVSLPEHLSSATRAEVTRLAVSVGVDPLTKLCLMKASYLFCMSQHVQWMIIGARNEALIRNYRRLGFGDALGHDDLVPLAHTGGLLHRILAFDVLAAERTWAAIRHPLYAFMVQTQHDDISIELESTVARRPGAPVAQLAAG